HDPHWPVPRELGLEQLSPAGVVVEVTRHEGYVEVARLADRLAVVEALKYGEQPRLLLDLTREGVQVSRAGVAGEPGPLGQCLSGGAHRGVHVGLARLRDARQ